MVVNSRAQHEEEPNPTKGREEKVGVPSSMLRKLGKQAIVIASHNFPLLDATQTYGT